MRLQPETAEPQKKSSRPDRPIKPSGAQAMKKVMKETGRNVQRLSLPAVFTSSHPAPRDDPRPLPRHSATSTPAGLTLLNKASSYKTPSCLSAPLRYKSFIKHDGHSRSISHHPPRGARACVCVRSHRSVREIKRSQGRSSSLSICNDLCLFILQVSTNTAVVKH